MQCGLEDSAVPAVATDLVVIGASVARAPAGPRPLAGFVTQLLACRGQLPAYRARRRAEPGVATACYGGAGAPLRGSTVERLL
jgi:hypothetical protein